MLEAVEEKTTKGAALMRTDLGLVKAEEQLWHGEPEERWQSEDEGPNGFGLAHPRMRARVFYR
jgi:hypothetical protein